MAVPVSAHPAGCGRPDLADCSPPGVTLMWTQAAAALT